MTDAEAKHRIILALDLGTKTGWAIQSYTGTVFSGTLEFRAQRFEGGGMQYLRFHNWLNKVMEGTGKIEEVCFEEVRRHLGVTAAHVYGGFLAHLTSWCEQNGIPYRGIPVGTIKKHATGKGNASKQEVMEAMWAKGYAPKDDNEADALALLDYVLTEDYQEGL